MRDIHTVSSMTDYGSKKSNIEIQDRWHSNLCWKHSSEQNKSIIVYTHTRKKVKKKIKSQNI